MPLRRAQPVFVPKVAQNLISETCATRLHNINRRGCCATSTFNQKPPTTTNIFAAKYTANTSEASK